MSKVTVYQKIFIIVYLFSILVFLCHYLYVGSGVWGDGRYYYSFLRSIVIDHDLNFTNEFQYFHIPIEQSQTGLVINKFSIGPAILWSPFFLLVHLLTWTASALGLIIKADGFSWPYQVFVGIGSVTYATFGLYLCFLALKKITTIKISLLASLSIYLSGNLFFYSSIDPINSHSVSFFASSLFFYLIIKYFKKQKLTQRDVVLIGLITGLIALIRNQDVVLGIIGIWLIITLLNDSVITKLAKLISYFTVIIIVIIPQLIIWQLIFGQINSPYILLGEKFNWFQPQLLNVLFSSNHGLFYYSPILMFAVIGLILTNKDWKWFGVLSLIIFILQTWIVGSWHSWWAGESYGNRMFISVFPLFIYGFALWLKKFDVDLKKVLLLAVLIIFNFITIIKYLLSI